MADNPILQDSQRPFSLRYPSSLSSKQRQAIYHGQVRAFLEASEIVEMEEDVLDDILDGFDGFDSDTIGFVAEEQSFIPVRKLERDAAGNIELPLPYGFYVYFGPQDDMAPRWTKQQIKGMLAYLKHRGKRALQVLTYLDHAADRYCTGLSSFVKEYVITRAIPIPKLLCAFDVYLCEELQEKKPTTLVYFLQVVLSGELQLRERLPQYSTLEDAVNLITSARRMLILTGAGISVSCGIPDFRSRDGLYATLKEKGEYDLDDPQQMFDIEYFKENPSVRDYRPTSSRGKPNAKRFTTSSFARQIYPSNFAPSPCHRFIKLIEDNGQLLRNYTQNIDTLETVVGVRNVLQCHGSFATASCLECRIRVPGNVIEQEIMQGEVPLCKSCSDSGKVSRNVSNNAPKRRSKPDSDDEEDDPLFPPWIMKPDITFFGEKLTDNFEKCLEADREQADLLLIIGTSLKVAPVSDIITHMPHSVPQILINKTPVTHINPDIILLGDADNIIQHLCDKIGWILPPAKAGQYLSGQFPTLMKRRSQEYISFGPKRVTDSHIWLFEGAEGGKWLSDLEAAQAQAVQTSDPPPNTQPSPSAPMTVVDAPRDAKRARVL